MRTVQVHRYRDAVAVATASTLYISAKDARTLATRLLVIAESIDNESFEDSPHLTLSLPGKPSAMEVGK